MSPQIVQGGFAIVRFYFVTKIYYIPQNSANFLTSLYLVLYCTAVHVFNNHVYYVRTYLFFLVLSNYECLFSRTVSWKIDQKALFEKMLLASVFWIDKKGTTKPMSCMV